MVDGKAEIRSGEDGHLCDYLAMDAGAVLIGRQKNEPPVFLSDQYRKPDETVERIRAVFSREVVAYPQRETEAQERKDLEEYVRMTKARCYSAYMKSVAPDP